MHHVESAENTPLMSVNATSSKPTPIQNKSFNYLLVVVAVAALGLVAVFSKFSQKEITTTSLSQEISTPISRVFAQADANSDGLVSKTEVHISIL